MVNRGKRLRWDLLLLLLGKLFREAIKLPSTGFLDHWIAIMKVWNVMVLSRQYIVTLMAYFCVRLKSVKHIGSL